MKDLIRTCEVATVIQAHDRHVTAFLKDGARYEAIEPQLDDIIRFITELGKDIPIATE